MRVVQKPILIRFYILESGEILEPEFWCNELVPMDPKSRPIEEWAQECFSDIANNSDLREDLGLPSGNLQVLVDGTIWGSGPDYFDEYDEGIDFGRPMFAGIPADYLQYLIRKDGDNAESSIQDG